MGVFNAYSDAKHYNRPISEKFLRKIGFAKSAQWGSPSQWGKDTAFWEMYIMDKSGLHVIGTIIYFPDTFRGYTTAFGKKSNNKVLYSANPYDNYKEADAVCEMDIRFVIDFIKQNSEK